MRIIFLDIDGVLNDDFTWEHFKTKSGYTFVDEIYIKKLKQIVEATAAKIVLSSDWRFGMYSEYPQDKEDFEELQNKLLEFGLEIFDKTPIINHGRHRGVEIQKWLDEHENLNIENFVILDDRVDMEPNNNNLVWIMNGIRDYDVENAIEMLTM